MIGTKIFKFFWAYDHLSSKWVFFTFQNAHWGRYSVLDKLHSRYTRNLFFVGSWLLGVIMPWWPQGIRNEVSLSSCPPYCTHTLLKFLFPNFPRNGSCTCWLPYGLCDQTIVSWKLEPCTPRQHVQVVVCFWESLVLRKTHSEMNHMSVTKKSIMLTTMVIYLASCSITPPHS
jgi:hypothetical protein